MKKLWLSKVFWVNVIGGVILVLEGVKDPTLLQYTGEALVVLNVVLRLITSEGIGWVVRE